MKLKTTLFRGRGNYAYVTARVKGKKKNLLTVDAYPKLMRMQNAQIARLLGETTYREEMTALARHYSGSELIERALNMNLARVYTDILGYCKGDLRHLVEEYLDVWNVWNIKTILRGVEHGIPSEEVWDSLVPAGSLDVNFLRELISLETTEDVLKALADSEFSAPPDEVMERFLKKRNLSIIEDYYDRIYYSTLLEAISGNSKPEKIYRIFIQSEIDVVNAKNLIELKIEGMNPQRIMEYMIPGGNALPIDRLEELVELEPAEVLESVKSSLDTDLDGITIDAGIHRIALHLDQYLLRLSEKMSRIYPLSILPVIDFIIQKKKEVDFIRIIVKGKDNDLPEEIIRELLVI